MSDISFHAIESRLDGRVSHLVERARRCARVGNVSASAPQTPAQVNTNRVGVRFSAGVCARRSGGSIGRDGSLVT